MIHAGRTVRTAHPVWMALIVGLCGCGTVLGIDDWQQAGAGGAGGDSANASTGSGQASAQNSSSGSGMTGSEVCSNAADDDADGLVDCADSDCAGYTCVADIPPDWIGPVAIFMGDALTPPPPCDSEWGDTTDFLAGTLSAPDAQCTACNCGAPTGGVCNLVPTTGLTFYKDLPCTMVGNTTPTPASQCTLAVSAPGYTVTAYKVTAAAYAVGGACAASGGNPSIEPPHFDKVARICAGPVRGGGCGTQDGCIPPPPSSFRSSLCIYRPVTNDEVDPQCPTGYSPLPMLYTGIADMRTCSACQCGSPAGQSCSPTAHVYGNALTCTGGAVQTLDYCNALAGPTTAATMRVQVDQGTPMNGGCGPTGGLPAGEAVGTGRALACCLP